MLCKNINLLNLFFQFLFFFNFKIQTLKWIDLLTLGKRGGNSGKCGDVVDIMEDVLGMENLRGGKEGAAG